MPHHTRQQFRFFHRLRVRWSEVDVQKIVFNAHYLTYFDTAIADYWRALALPYDATMQALQGDLYLKKTELEFHASAHMDDQLDVALKCSRVGSSSMIFSGEIFRGDERLVSCQLIYVFADPATQTSKPVPKPFKDILLGYEAGESVTSIQVGDWQTLGVAAWQVRSDVFIDEQHIPVEIERDELDATALHALLRNRLGLPVATGRLLEATNGVSRVGRMAVNRVLRGSSLGRDVLQALLQAARERGDREVMLHAQRSAEGFVARFGFVPRGEPFAEAGIAHIEMVQKLN